MRYMKPALLLWITITSAVFSQSVYINFHPIAGFPLGAFKDHVDNFGFGFDGSFMMPLGDSPFWAGIEADALFFDTKAQEISTPAGIVNQEPIKGTIIGMLVFRTQIDNEYFRPYFDTLFGFQHLFSETGGVQGPIYGVVEDGSTFEATEKDQVFCAGAGAGFMFLVHTFARSNDDKAFKELWLDARFRYLYGGKIDYLVDYNRTDGDQVIFNSTRGRTDLLTFQLGISLGF